MNQLPERGALVWFDFTPLPGDGRAGHEQAGDEQAGHEQAGDRPALVISPRRYHERSKLAAVCPITSNTQPWPWKVMLPDGLAATGAVLVDRVRSIDRGARRLRLVGHAPEAVVAEVQARLAALFGIAT